MFKSLSQYRTALLIFADINTEAIKAFLANILYVGYLFYFAIIWDHNYIFLPHPSKSIEYCRE